MTEYGQHGPYQNHTHVFATSSDYPKDKTGRTEKSAKVPCNERLRFKKKESSSV